MTKGFWSHSWFTIPVLLFFIAGLALNLALPYGDEILFFNPWRAEPANTLFRLATMLGEYPFFILTGVPLLLYRYRYGILIALTGLIISPLAYTAKDSIKQERPITFFRQRGLEKSLVVVPGVRLNMGRTSFPSGHTMAAFGLYSALAVIICRPFPRLGLLLAMAAILTALSRIFLIQHFLGDVLAGAALGLLVSEFARQLLNIPFFKRQTWMDGGVMRKVWGGGES